MTDLELRDSELRSLGDIGKFLLENGQYKLAVSCYAMQFRMHSKFFSDEAANLVANFPADHDGGRWVAPDGLFDDGRMPTDVFSKIYESGIWGGGSGGGSSINRAAQYAGLLQNFIRTEKVRKVCDIGCGDWQFSQFLDFGDSEYIGYDVVESVVERNERVYGSAKINFIKADVSSIEIPECDLLICKDVMQHLNNDLAISLSRKFNAARVCLITNDFALENLPSRTGDTRPLNLIAEPFRLPAKPIFAFDGKVVFQISR
ncbi:methyltransferase domain-containing protein [Methylobacterium phyllosphaerae]